MKRGAIITALFALIFIAAAGVTAEAQTVKITPLGSRTGEFCGQDRALLFEDPTGVRILYDPGNTIAGGADERLGEVHAILISHAHGDHLGTDKLNSNPGTGGPGCAGSTTIAAANSNLAEIAAVKNSAVIAGGSLAGFVGGKIAAVLQSASNTPGCTVLPGITNETTVPRTAPCTAGLGIGAKRIIRMTTATQGVQIAAVPADHPNDPPLSLLSDPEMTELASNRISPYLGLANGFVVAFTNGLRVYLSGDSGFSTEMSTLIRGFYGANMAVLNIGDVFTIGPEEGAFAVAELLRVNAVIPSHVNESATMGGVVQSGTRTARFIELLGPRGASAFDDRGQFRPRRRIPVYPPLSGITMEFDGHARCTVGCPGQ